MTVTERELLRGYQSAAVKASGIARDHALRVAVTERVVELLAYRRWYRQNRWAEWSDMRIQHETELRALLRVVRLAKRAAETTVVDAEPEWQEAELREAWGR
jgi:hypothetical protein